VALVDEPAHEFGSRVESKQGTGKAKALLCFAMLQAPDPALRESTKGQGLQKNAAADWRSIESRTEKQAV
jgi:hypothetical protein